ncbi:hypothetical protein ACEPAI_3326 [Sanghuangporus weigelae]
MTDRTSCSMVETNVDQGVTSVCDYNFYLQAHAGTQGIAHTAHYTILHDDKKLSPDSLQQGIDNISYLWSQSMKGVSLIPPAYSSMRKVMSPVEGSKEDGGRREVTRVAKSTSCNKG